MQVNGQFVSSDFFSMLGVKTLIGRTFAGGEDEIGAAPIALIGEGLWRRKFDAASDILSKSIMLDGRAYAVVGVIPASFRFSIAGLVSSGSVSAYRSVEKQSTDHSERRLGHQRDWPPEAGRND